MKRSSFVEQALLRLRELGIRSGDAYDSYDLLGENVESILAIFEEAGMLPPATKREQDDDDIRKNGVVYGGFYNVNEWDEE